MISVLVPTKGRPIEYKRMVESVVNTSSHAKVFTGLSEEDKSVYGIIPDIVTPEWMPTAHKWELLANHAFKTTNSDLFMLGADDTVFATKGWDTVLLEHYRALSNKVHVYSMHDSRTGTGTPHPIVTKEYIEAMGYFLPPLFLHWFVDTWTVEIARANNCFTHLMDYTLIHDKSSDRKSGKWSGDETRNGIRKNGWLTRDIYTNQSCAHFLEIEKERLANFIKRNVQYKTHGSPQDFLEATQ